MCLCALGIVRRFIVEQGAFWRLLAMVSYVLFHVENASSLFKQNIKLDL